MIEIKGSYFDGKMFRCTETGRWAKVMVTKFSTRVTMISCALGHKGEYRAFEVHTDIKTQKHAKEHALDWVKYG